MDDEIARIVVAERRRSERAAIRRTARLAQARVEATRLAARFAQEDPTVRQIVLFGSVAAGTVRSESFDIDLAVDTDNYLALVLASEESPFRVDVVDLRTVSPELRARILKSGTVLHGSQT